MECIEVNLTKLDEKRRNMLMLRQLAEVRRLAVSEEYMNMRNSSFENTSTTICPVCKRVIGDSVFTWNPNGVIMHTACAIPKYPSLLEETRNCLNTVFMKSMWKSLRMVSLMNRFFGFTSFPWLRNTTSSSHLRPHSICASQPSLDASIVRRK